MARKTREQYIEELKVKNPDIELVGDYVDAKTKTLHYCKKHKIFWDTTPNNALHGSGCTQCLKEKIRSKNCKSEDDYVKELAIKNPTIKLCGEYIDSKTPIKHYCKTHSVFWDIAPGNALQGKGCKFCCKERIGLALKKSEDEYITELTVKNPTVKLRGEYLGADILTRHYCEIHNILFDTTPSHALQGCGCQECHNDRLPQRQPKLEEQYIGELSKKHPNIVLTGKYINSITPTLHKCLVHNFEWNPTPGNLLSGKGCPKCNESQGEKQITLWLEQNMIVNISQKRFEDCRDIYTLPFDFYVPELNICIEYQGEQHYRPVKFGGISDDKAYSNFVTTQHHDKIKSDYCINNNIKLICIPYWEDVNEYLNKNLLI